MKERKTVDFRQDMGVSSVSEKERRSTKEVGSTYRLRNLNVPIGLYRDLQYVAEQEGKQLPATVFLLLRLGFKEWREDRVKRLTRKGEE